MLRVRRDSLSTLLTGCHPGKRFESLQESKSKGILALFPPSPPGSLLLVAPAVTLSLPLLLLTSCDQLRVNGAAAAQKICSTKQQDEREWCVYVCTLRTQFLALSLYSCFVLYLDKSPALFPFFYFLLTPSSLFSVKSSFQSSVHLFSSLSS